MLTLSDSNTTDYYSNSWDQETQILENLYLKTQLQVEKYRNKCCGGRNMMYNLM